MNINLWVESSISTDRIISNLLNDISDYLSCSTQQISNINLPALNSGINIFCRISDHKYAWVPDLLKSYEIPYIYYLDDNFWKIQGDTELAKYYQSPNTIKTLDKFISSSHLSIVNSESILNFISIRFPEARCKLLPAPFDIELVKNLKKKPKKNNRITVGYAGTYKSDELAIIGEVVKILSEKRPDIYFEFIGGKPENLTHLENVQYFPGTEDYQDYLKFKISRNWDIGIAPLLDTPFNRSKTNNKFREYGGCGITGLYSNVTPYKNSITHGITGHLVENDVSSWVEAIILIADDDIYREEIGRAAKIQVQENHSHTKIGTIWLEAIKEIPSYNDKSPISLEKKLRFNYVKFHLESQSPELAYQAGIASTPTLIKRRILETLRLYLEKTNPRKTLTVFIIAALAITIININIYLVYELLT